LAIDPLIAPSGADRAEPERLEDVAAADRLDVERQPLVEDGLVGWGSERPSKAGATGSGGSSSGLIIGVLTGLGLRCRPNRRPRP